MTSQPPNTKYPSIEFIASCGGREYGVARSSPVAHGRGRRVTEEEEGREREAVVQRSWLFEFRRDGGGIHDLKNLIRVQHVIDVEVALALGNVIPRRRKSWRQHHKVAYSRLLTEALGTSLLLCVTESGSDVEYLTTRTVLGDANGANLAVNNLLLEGGAVNCSVQSPRANQPLQYSTLKDVRKDWIQVGMRTVELCGAFEQR
jgi:hypothetical protein